MFTTISTQPHTNTDKPFENALSQDLNGIMIVLDLNNTAGATYRLDHVQLTITHAGQTLLALKGFTEFINHARQIYDASSVTAGATSTVYIPLRQKYYEGKVLNYRVTLSGTMTDGTIRILKDTGKPVTVEDRIIRTPTALAVKGDKAELIQAGYLDYIAFDAANVVDAEGIKVVMDGIAMFEEETKALVIYNGLSDKCILPIGRNVKGDSRVEATTTIATAYALQAKYTNPVGRVATEAERAQMARAAEATRQAELGIVSGNGFGLM